jgi:uncharacterized membrane protein YfcA
VTTAAFALAFGLGIGLLLGSVGAGGSILAVPVLVYILDQPVKEATTESLFVVGTAALVGAADHARVGRVHLTIAAAFGAAGAMGAVVGTFLNRIVGEQVLLLAFALLLLSVAATMLLTHTDETARDRDTSLARVAVVGIGTGALTGFLGVGGGFIIVPALILLLGLPAALAVGTSLLVIALISGAAVAAHLSTGGVNWTIALTLAGGAIAGALAGRRTGLQLKPARFNEVFAVLLIAVAVFVIAEDLVLA